MSSDPSQMIILRAINAVTKITIRTIHASIQINRLYLVFPEVETLTRDCEFVVLFSNVIEFEVGSIPEDVSSLFVLFDQSSN